MHAAEKAAGHGYRLVYDTAISQSPRRQPSVRRVLWRATIAIAIVFLIIESSPRRAPPRYCMYDVCDFVCTVSMSLQYVLSLLLYLICLMMYH